MFLCVNLTSGFDVIFFSSFCIVSSYVLFSFSRSLSVSSFGSGKDVIEFLFHLCLCQAKLIYGLVNMNCCDTNCFDCEDKCFLVFRKSAKNMKMKKKTQTESNQFQMHTDDRIARASVDCIQNSHGTKIKLKIIVFTALNRI